MLREIWNFFGILLSATAVAIAITLALTAAVGLVCYTGAYAIAEAMYDRPIEMRTTSNFNYPPLIIKIKTPDGKTLEATAEFEGETEQHQ